MKDMNGKTDPAAEATTAGDARSENTSARRSRPRIREVLVVEGRYDRNALSQVVDALIFETGGFSIFHNPEKLKALRMLADERGLILLTDPDGAGLVIRSRLKGLLPPEKIRQAYIPQVEGKERRKQKPSKQGLLGVEGMPPEVLLRTLRAAGATEEAPGERGSSLTAADFYALGLTGKPGSAALRRKLAESLDLPGNISQKDLRKAAELLLTAEELRELLTRLTSG